METLSIEAESQLVFSQVLLLFQNAKSSMLFLIAAVFVLLMVVSAMISGSEVAFFSLKDKDKARLQESKNYLDKLIIRLLARPKMLLATILITNNLVNVSAIVLYALSIRYFVELGNNPFISFLLEAVLITFIIVIFGELVPKIYANQNNYKFSKFVVIPLSFLVRFFSPVSKLMVKSTQYLDKRLKRHEKELSSEEIKQAIDITSGKNADTDDRNILKRIVSFRNVSVNQIMTSRPDVIAFDADIPFSKLLEEINNNRFSRVPVYKESLDNITGLLYIKDVLEHIEKDDQFDWLRLLRKTHFVPESKKIDDLLRVFQSKKVHFAVVVDEYGGFSGIITMEDILEEIVGEITDEFDEPEESLYRQLNENTYVFNARISLNEFSKVLNLPDEKFENYLSDVETLGGLMVELLGKIPVEGEHISYHELDFSVESAERKKVKEVKVVLNEDYFHED